jgi:hypothetical protein
MVSDNSGKPFVSKPVDLPVLSGEPSMTHNSITTRGRITIKGSGTMDKAFRAHEVVIAHKKQNSPSAFSKTLTLPSNEVLSFS